MCGIIAIIGAANVFSKLYEGLLTIQHRGQDATGVATFDGSGFYLKKGYGLVRDVFDIKHVERLRGSVGIGHVRYPTYGGVTQEDAQPFMVNYPHGIVMAHNGQVTNYLQLKKELMEKSGRHLNSTCDVEPILNVFAEELNYSSTKKDDLDSIFNAVEAVQRRVKGSYSVVAMIANKGLLSFRDPWGIRPLIMGKHRTQNSYAFASESAALDIIDYHGKEDVPHGSAVFIDMQGEVHRKQCYPKIHTPCIFEYVYFARPDSFLDRIGVYESRVRFGERLARAIGRLDIDVVIPVPDSARTSAISLARTLGVKYREGLVKNRYIGRTFIMANNQDRIRSVRRKLNPIRMEFRDRNVLIVDDSIVRGNTSKGIVSIARSCGAKKVYFAVTSPPLRHPCIYGIDMSTQEELLAHGLTNREIVDALGADDVIYLPMEDMVGAVKDGDCGCDQFCTACFSGEYPTQPSEAIFRSMRESRLMERGNQ